MSFGVLIPDTNCHVPVKGANRNGFCSPKRITRGGVDVIIIVVDGHGAALSMGSL